MLTKEIKANVRQAKTCTLIVPGRDDVHHLTITKKQALELLASDCGFVTRHHGDELIVDRAFIDTATT